MQLVCASVRTSWCTQAHGRTGGTAQEWVRNMLGCVGRGGNAQAIRDEILNIMHRNHIGEKRGTWMEVPTFTHSAAHCSAFGRHTAAVLCLSCNQKGIHTVQLGSYSSSCTLTHYSLAASTNCLCAVKSALLLADCRAPNKGKLSTSL